MPICASSPAVSGDSLGSVLVFDSGVGGLSVLREARVLIPERPFVYLADDAGFPYGDWPEGELSAHLLRLFADYLAQLRPQLVIIACNTAFTLAGAALRARFPEQVFVGTVPAIKPAAERSRSKLITVLATPGTVAREYTRDLIDSFAHDCQVQLVGAARLAAMAEQYLRGAALDRGALAQEIAPCFVEQGARRTDIVVLACTHYPFLVNEFRRLAPWPVDWLDPAAAIARRARSLLAPAPLDLARACADRAIFTSGRPDERSRRLMHSFGLAA